MKKRILLLSGLVVLGSVIFSSYQNGAARNGYDCTGAEAAGTGSYVNPNGCYQSGSGCHSSSATASLGVAIELDSAGVPTTHYKGGMTYSVKITGTATGTANTHYGFQLNALRGTASASSNADAGTFSSTGLPAGTRFTAPGTYTQLTCMEHSSVQTLSGGTFSKSFTWTARASGTGTISFWGAANFVNNNGNADAGDVWNTNHVTIAEWPTPTAVAQVAAGIAVRVYPNPVTDVLNIDNIEGKYTVNIVDLAGRNVYSSVVDGSNSSPIAINTSNWTSGLYEIMITNGALSQVIPVIKR